MRLDLIASDEDAVPSLETKSLLLRAHRAEDLPACMSLWNDPDVRQSLLSGREAPEQEVWFRMLRYAGMWSLKAYGYFAIVEKASGRLIGEAGFADFKRATAPDLGNDPEIGWVIHSSVAGQGYAGEAVAAVQSWFDRRHPGQATFCIINPVNLRSLRVADRAGYHRDGTCLLGETELAVLKRAGARPTENFINGGRA